MADSGRYDATTIALHWTTAALVAIQWASGQTIDWFPRGPLRVDARSVHLVIGVSLVAVIALRLFWRNRRGRRLPPAGTGAFGLAARGVHHLLYFLVAAVLLGGVATEALRGDVLFGLIHLPTLGGVSGPERHAWAEKVGDLHGLGANAILLVAGLHSGAALFHHFILRDRVLGRMLPG